MGKNKNLAMASALEKLASEMEAYAVEIEKQPEPATNVKQASASAEYGYLDSRPSAHADDAISRWLLG